MGFLKKVEINTNQCGSMSESVMLRTRIIREHTFWAKSLKQADFSYFSLILLRTPNKIYHV